MKICVPCKTEMRCAKTGVIVYFGDNENHLHSMDVFECPQCKAQVAVGDRPGYHHSEGIKNAKEGFVINVQEG